MTDRIHGCVVYFDRDIREDEVAPILDAIRHIRGVAVVSTNDTRAKTHEVQTAKARIIPPIIEFHLCFIAENFPAHIAQTNAPKAIARITKPIPNSLSIPSQIIAPQK